MDLENCNLTELVVLAQATEPEAHHGLGRDLLIAIIEGEELDLPKRQINKQRILITAYLDKFWEQVGSLVSCPAKTRDPWACFGCSDVQAACCILDNIEKIEEET